MEQAANVRTALSLLIDRQYLVDTVAQCGQQLANTFIPAGMLDGHGGEFRVNDDTYTFPDAENTGYFGFDLNANTEKARELLESAGYVFDENGMLSAETPLSFEYLTNTGTGHEGIAQCVQQDLALLGINMTIRTVEWDVFLNERKDGTTTSAATAGLPTSTTRSICWRCGPPIPATTTASSVANPNKARKSPRPNERGLLWSLIT